jgi:hypothetical protein
MKTIQLKIIKAVARVRETKNRSTLPGIKRKTDPEDEISQLAVVTKTQRCIFMLNYEFMN